MDFLDSFPIWMFCVYANIELVIRPGVIIMTDKERYGFLAAFCMLVLVSLIGLMKLFIPTALELIDWNFMLIMTILVFIMIHVEIIVNHIRKRRLNND